MLELESSTIGAGASVEAVAAAALEDQGGVAELGFGAGGRVALEGVPDPELVAQAKRRRFTAEYKARILVKVDACTRPGEVGELLRAGAVHVAFDVLALSSARDGGLRELGKSRGRKPVDRREEMIAKLRAQAGALRGRACKRACRVIEIQGNVSALLEELLGSESAQRSTER